MAEEHLAQAALLEHGEHLAQAALLEHEEQAEHREHLASLVQAVLVELAEWVDR